MTRTEKAAATRGKRVSGGVAKPRAQASVDARTARAAKADEVLRLMVDEGMSTTSACKQVGLGWQAFCSWCEDAPDHVERYTRARAQLLERMAEEIHQIADTPVEGVTITTKADGGVEAKRADMIEHRRLQIESRKWLLAKLMPKKYGDKQHIEHSGSIGLEGLIAGDDGEG